MLDAIALPGQRAAVASLLSGDWFLGKYATNYYCMLHVFVHVFLAHHREIWFVYIRAPVLFSRAAATCVLFFNLF